MATARTEDLFPDVRNPPDIRVVNERCVVSRRDRHCLVIVCGIVLSQYAWSDQLAEAYSMVRLVQLGWADQNDVARSFGYSTRTLRRYQRRFEDSGLAALAQGSGFPKGGRRLPRARSRWIERLKALGYSNCEIARRGGVSETAIRKLLRRLGWKPSAHEPVQLPLLPEPSSNPNLSAFSVPGPAAASASQDSDPANRWADRLLACLGLLDDAAPLFGSGKAVPRAGVLLALPALVQSGVFECAQQIYGSLGPAFYGLRTSLLTLLLMALWRIKRPEGLKEQSPPELGPGCWGWIARPRSRPCGANLAVWRPAAGRRSLAARWPSAGSPNAARRWGFCMWTATCGFITASIRCPKPTWRGCACRCRPVPTTGSTTAVAICCLSSQPKPMPAW